MRVAEYEKSLQTFTSQHPASALLTTASYTDATFLAAVSRRIQQQQNMNHEYDVPYVNLILVVVRQDYLRPAVL